jgi:2-dehydropantoate 2-reductase
VQYSQLPSVLPAIAANESRSVIFVGNNADARATKSYLERNSPTEKRVAFGFQATGGRREEGRIVSIRMGGRMDLGALGSSLGWRSLIDEAFASTRYRLRYFDDMDAWLKSHIALIMPLCFAAYACGGDLRRLAGDSEFLGRVVSAVDEGYAVLERIGLRILPAGDAEYARRKRKSFVRFLRIAFATPIGKLAISSHAISASDEMIALSDAFDRLKREAGIATPNWDSLEPYLTRRRAGPPSMPFPSSTASER